jgi:hypothetical protein
MNLQGSCGSVTLGGISPVGTAKGSFALTFGSVNVDGAFSASFCAEGHEP